MYSLLAGGYIEVKATSKRAAEDLVYEFETRKLLENADFEDSLEISFVEEI
jgi:hypothetical protein